MPLTILTEIEAKSAGCNSDWFAAEAARKALVAGRAAYWSAHLYHNQIACNAAPLANVHDLDTACSYVSQRSRFMSSPAAVGAFLDRLHPANDLARVALIVARAKWCATFEDAAIEEAA